MKYLSGIQYTEDFAGARIYMKRDDLIPFSFGGNKVRIASELISNLKERGFNSVISYGSAGSNMNRAVAHTAFINNIKCRVIIKKDDLKTAKSEPLNERLVRESGAEIIYCTADNVQGTVEAVMNSASENGEKPYYIYGSSLGEGNRTALMMAYFKEYGEIRTWEKENGIRFDHIFLAVGTGVTIGGLAAGLLTELKTGAADVPGIHGISIARTAEREKEIILDNIGSFNPSVMTEKTDGFDITDEYLSGGYGHYGETVKEEIKRMFVAYHIPLDPTYTGKAYCGMKSEIGKKGIGGNVLFIHTGGYPLFLDSAGDIFG